MSLPSHTLKRARGGGQVVVDVAERDEVRAEIRHLDADGLLPRDRREDSDLGRRERVAQVVLQVRDLADLRAGRELQLVPRDPRAGDLADDGRIDAEVREAGDEGLGHTRIRLAGRAAAGLGLLQKAAVRKLVVGYRHGRLEQRLLGVLLVEGVRRLVRLLHEEDRRRARDRVRDEIGVILSHVDRRLERVLGRGQLGDLVHALGALTPHPGVRAMELVAGAAKDGTEARPGQEERSGDRQ